MEKAQNRQSIKVTERYRQDLELHKESSNSANKGISLNMLTYKTPMVVYYTDSCPAGLGGCAYHGRAWRWEVPSRLRNHASLNFLEFISSVISQWIDIIEGNMLEYSCVMSMNDSSTMAGWMATKI